MQVHNLLLLRLLPPGLLAVLIGLFLEESDQRRRLAPPRNAGILGPPALEEPRRLMDIYELERIEYRAVTESSPWSR
jgi:hypothetical protein